MRTSRSSSCRLPGASWPTRTPRSFAGRRGSRRSAGSAGELQPARRLGPRPPPVQARAGDARPGPPAGRRGITGGDVTMYSSRRIFDWTEGNYVVSDEFTHVVDTDDVAPFSKSPFFAYDNIVN